MKRMYLAVIVIVLGMGLVACSDLSGQTPFERLRYYQGRLETTAEEYKTEAIDSPDPLPIDLENNYSRSELEAYHVVGLSRREYYRNIIANMLSYRRETLLSLEECDALESYSGTIRLDHAEDNTQTTALCRNDYHLVIRNEVGGGLLVRIVPDGSYRNTSVFQLSIDNNDRLVIRSATYQREDRPREEGPYSYFEYVEGVGYHSLSVISPGVQYGNYDETTGDYVSFYLYEGRLGNRTWYHASTNTLHRAEVYSNVTSHYLEMYGDDVVKLALHWSNNSAGEELSIQYDLFEVAGWDRVVAPYINTEHGVFNKIFLGDTESILPPHFYWLLVMSDPVQLTLGMIVSNDTLTDAYLDGSEIGLAIADSRFTTANVDLERSLFETTILSFEAYSQLEQISNNERVYPSFVKRSLYFN